MLVDGIVVRKERESSSKFFYLVREVDNLVLFGGEGDVEVESNFDVSIVSEIL